MSTERVRVLHVEDNPGDARLMRELLRDGGGKVWFDVINADCISGALERLAAERFDVVLLDLSLPDAHGLETVHRILGGARDVPIVVLTGFDDETLALRAVQVGAQDYLLKNQLDSHRCMRSILYAIERHRSSAALRSQTLLDEMTGLYNRRGFLALAQQQLRHAGRELAPVVLIFCDLDDLKEINDTHGHQEGDRALVAAADLLRGTLRDDDLIARLGGDEFVVLALDSSGYGADPILARVRESFENFNRSSRRPYRLSVSMGCARRDPRGTSSIDELIAEADRALYEEKNVKRLARRTLTA